MIDDYGVLIGPGTVHRLRPPAGERRRTRCGYPQVRRGRLTPSPVKLEHGAPTVDALLERGWTLCGRCFPLEDGDR